MKKETDKRLIIPKDAFEEEASEGLGRLNREEAAEDMRDLEGRMATRLRRPKRIWIPAAAAVTVILVASTVYIGLFRGRQTAETAMVEESKKDTVLIAMAAPITKVEAKIEAETKAKAKVKAEVKAKVEAEVKAERIIEIIEMEAVVEEVIVQAVPERSKTAQGIPARTEAKTEADHGPRPAVVIEALNTWISSNIRYPHDVLPRTGQQVIVSFKVRADSTVYGLKAEQTPGERFTEEVFRLLREGPKWEPAIRNGTPVAETVRVSILFK